MMFAVVKSDHASTAASTTRAIAGRVLQGTTSTEKVG